ncbi:imelysin family protein [Pseudoruegeria sp. SK021]|uniref:imelysin family protein n=1 Tax=Pseudoruegeria sp. SK021 TaxID=1933035 RepID=UPI000A221C1F|nr:imelysin family protein [Pseudoruegeria sp. SK021]OSP55928.1 signal peptidase [Pseudoruegeria sp. SK021]
MKHLAVLIALAPLSLPASADTARAVNDLILPSFENFAQGAQVLHQTALADCRSDAVAPAYQAAFDTWMGVSGLRIGPSETGALSIAFWPDDRGFTQRTLARLIDTEDPTGLDPSEYHEMSIAARGLFALDMLLYDPAFNTYGAGDYTCGLVQTITADLDRQADALSTSWAEDYAEVLIGAGAPDNTIYLSSDEAFRALYTQLLSGLEFTADTRLGRPMGTFERPRPKLAEAWRSDRSLGNVLISAQAAQGLAHALAGPELPQTDAAFSQVMLAADRVSDPSFQDLDDPQARLRVEVLQQRVRALYGAIEIEIGAPLGITPGFNSQDGD